MSKIGREYIDDLTDLYNRRFLNKSAVECISEASQKKTSLSIAIIDLDHFKNVNDTYGHLRGDSVLIEFSVFLKDLLRKDDTVYRYGGDEFVCILPNTDYEQARRISCRIIEQCHSIEFSRIRQTLSIGIASYPSDGEDWLSVFNTADHRLYSAKRHGRDRVGALKKEEKRLVIPTEEIIGRDAEIVRIEKLINPVFTGSSSAVCISGEVGVGKTRLVHEIVKDPTYQDILLLESNLSATTKSIPYYPFREIIRNVIKTEGKGSITGIPGAYQIELMKIIPELSEELSEVDKGTFMLDKFRLFEGMRRFLALQSSKSSLFIYLDNIHWADDSSLELFHYLVRVLKESPIFFFFAYRIEEVKDSKLQNVLQLMAREGLYERIELEPLEPADVARILSFMIDADPSPELNDYINRETGGNPFFIEELMKSLEVNDAFIRSKDRVLFNKDKKIVIPYSVKGVVDRKLGMMGSEACDLLEYAAVIGRKFDFTFLRDMTEMNEGHLFDLMDEITDMRLLKKSGGERYYFSEDVIREMIYQQINEIKLKRYHQAVGERLLNLHKDRVEEVVEELSHHFYLCEDRERAIEFSMIAADRAKDAYANQDAIRFYTWTIECLKDRSMRGKELKEIECLKNRAGVLNLIGENEKALVDVNNAINKAKVIGNKKWEADCLIVLSNIYQSTAQYNEAIKKLEIILEISRELNDRNVEAASLNKIGVSYGEIGEYFIALKFFQKSLKIRKEIGDRKGEGTCLSHISIIYDFLGENSKALKFCKQALKIDREIGDRRIEAISLNNMGILYRQISKYTKALEVLQRSSKIMEEIGDRRVEGASFTNIGNIYYSLGEYQKSLEFFEHSLKIAKEINARKGEGINLNCIGNTYTLLGEYSKALEFQQCSLKIAEEIGDRSGEAISLLSIGDVFLEKDDIVTAEGYYNKAYSIAREIKSKSLLANISLSIVSLYLIIGNLTDAKKSLKQILSLVDELDSKEIKAIALCLSGRFYTKEKKWDEAESSFRKSILIFKETKNKFELAQVYYYQGLMFRESGARAEAEKHFAKAQKIFRKLDAKGWIKKTEECL